jgi:ketopantoate reductase
MGFGVLGLFGGFSLPTDRLSAVKFRTMAALPPISVDEEQCMNEPIVVVGTGEMGGVFTRGFLRLGHPIFPVTRNMEMAKVAKAITPPRLVLISVGEADLHPVLEQVPDVWRDRLVLLQNELLPRDWEAHGIASPTVIAVWFEKKKGQDYRVLVPSPVYGPQAQPIEQALETLGIPVWELREEQELLFELVRKNVYILTTNIAGLVVGGTVDELWNQHRELALTVAQEVMDIQAWLTGAELDRERLIAGMVEAIEGDLQHRCTGRSAPARLARAIEHADHAGLAVPRLREIQANMK